VKIHQKKSNFSDRDRSKVQGTLGRLGKHFVIMLIGLLGISIISLRLGPVDVDFASIWNVLVSYVGVGTSHGETETL
ncbi:uncharacterized protein METZ01_LOCUS167506, partial [marine metagenome]